MMHRRVMGEDGMTFGNGITLPKGTLLAVAERSIHHDHGECLLSIRQGGHSYSLEDNFVEGGKFDGFRWLQADGTSREVMTKVGVDCLTFGAGRCVVHSWIRENRL